MNIGDASSRSGVSAKMIRYYEQIGLIPPARRTASGYRDYAEADIHMLRFMALAQARVRDLRQKIAHLQEMAETLEDLARSCAGNDRPECPILRNLEAATSPAPDDCGHHAQDRTHPQERITS